MERKAEQPNILHLTRRQFLCQAVLAAAGVALVREGQVEAADPNCHAQARIKTETGTVKAVVKTRGEQDKTLDVNSQGTLVDLGVHPSDTTLAGKDARRFTYYAVSPEGRPLSLPTEELVNCGNIRPVRLREARPQIPLPVAAPAKVKFTESVTATLVGGDRPVDVNLRSEGLDKWLPLATLLGLGSVAGAILWCCARRNRVAAPPPAPVPAQPGPQMGQPQQPPQQP